MTNSLCVGWRTKRRAWVEGDMHARFIQQEERSESERRRFEVCHALFFSSFGFDQS
jgi:hypothetical protein